MSPADLSFPLREAISIPESVHEDDYVLRIHQAQQEAESTLRDYVVTDGIAEAFDLGLTMLSSALGSRTSKGAFIHGSFGSGKSHYMAVLHLLLDGNPGARALEGLQQQVAKHQDALEKNLLGIDYHFIGAESVEQKLFSGYLDTIREKHPDAPEPMLHKSDGLFDDAEKLRQDLGDEKFFAKLTGQAGGGSGWGALAAQGITPDTYEAARRAPQDDPVRQRVANELIRAYFSSYKDAGSWLDMETGLKAMTEHARGLGYDGVVLFLDELVLWLSGRLAQTTFIKTETEKITKLVETGGRLPIPVISYVARQRELSEFVGGSAPGAERVGMQDHFSHWEGRFEKITLPAQDLPEIVHRRLLAPTNEEGQAALDAAVQRVKRNRAAYQHLLTDAGNSTDIEFAKVYPFSPALVDAMIALSSIMQRERTALKIMSELLARRRDELTVGDVIGVGELYDVAVAGDSDPLTDEAKELFKQARSFYEQKMRPYLLNQHQLTEDQARAVDRTHPFHRQDKIAKTLLIGAIAPDAAALKDLTASKVAALNYGTITSYIPGEEGVEVAELARSWASAFGAITLSGSPSDPVLHLQLTSFDVDRILSSVSTEDTESNRRRVLRELISEQIGAQQENSLQAEYRLSYVWNGQRLNAQVSFTNVRDTHHDQLISEGAEWKLIISYPLEAEGQSPSDAQERITQLKQRGVESDTVIWLPHHINTARAEDLGTLVMLDFLLTGTRFDQYANHLAVAERAPAKDQLTSQRNNLREQLIRALRQAYGVDSGDEHIGARVHRHFDTLEPRYDPAQPLAAELAQAATAVLTGALDHRYPDHPRLNDPQRAITRSELTTTLTLARRAAEAGGRIESVERRELQQASRLITSFGIGTLNETTYVLQPAYFSFNDQLTKASGSSEPSVRQLRAALDHYGFSDQVVNLIILAWAAMHGREFIRHEMPVAAPGVDDLAADTVLREPVLPEHQTWTTALTRARELFGVARDEHGLNPAALDRVGKSLQQASSRHLESLRDLVRLLDNHRGALGIDDDSPRLSAARSLRDAVENVDAARTSLDRVNALGTAKLPTELAPAAEEVNAATDVATALRQAQWSMVESLQDSPEEAAQEALENLHRAAAAHQLHERLQPALAAATSTAADILTQRRSAGRPPEPTAPPQPQPTSQGSSEPSSVTTRSGVTERVDSSASAEKNRTYELQTPGDVEKLAAQLKADLIHGVPLRVEWRLQ